MKSKTPGLSSEEFWAEHAENMRLSDERLARMSPQERAALRSPSDPLTRKMQSGFDPTFKNVTPPPGAIKKGRRKKDQALLGPRAPLGQAVGPAAQRRPVQTARPAPVVAAAKSAS